MRGTEGFCNAPYRLNGHLFPGAPGITGIRITLFPIARFRLRLRFRFRLGAVYVIRINGHFLRGDRRGRRGRR